MYLCMRESEEAGRVNSGKIIGLSIQNTFYREHVLQTCLLKHELLGVCLFRPVLRPVLVLCLYIHTHTRTHTHTHTYTHTHTQSLSLSLSLSLTHTLSLTFKR
jgi:hypothetical protein